MPTVHIILDITIVTTSRGAGSVLDSVPNNALIGETNRVKVQLNEYSAITLHSLVRGMVGQQVALDRAQRALQQLASAILSTTIGKGGPKRAVG